MTISKSRNIIITGWPDSKDEIISELKLYWAYRDKLAVIDGIKFKAGT